MAWVRNIGIAALVCVFFPMQASFGFQKSTIQNSYIITKYDSHVGLPLKSATNIANSTNGYLYLATPNGLLQKDGIQSDTHSISTGSGFKTNRIARVFALENLLLVRDNLNYLYPFRDGRARPLLHPESGDSIRSGTVRKPDPDFFILDSESSYLWPGEEVRIFSESVSSHDPWDALPARDSSVCILNTGSSEEGIVEPEFNRDSEIWNRPEEPGRIQLSWLGPGSHTLLLFVNPNQDSVLKTYTSRITSSIYETSWYHLLIFFGTGMLLYLTFRHFIRSEKTEKGTNVIAPAIQDVKQERDIPSDSEEENVRVHRSEILELIHDRYTDPDLSVTQITGMLNCSKSTLYRKWNKHHEQSISDYVIELRLKKAKQLIIEDRYTISEIAHMIGFTSQSYFTKVFKKKVGVSPTKYASDKHQL
ncbi:MAG: helix-turn-helix transcriptional regulator [Candidatus Paceibacterota bacterium]